jgi:LysR family transcriptional regulator, hypochlorite-specific transcription factor HypT
METKWLEDFLSLVESRSFSRSAEARHVSQPAFSRRIRSLESWLGVDLIDRTTYPLRLTKAGDTFHASAQELLAAIHQSRADVLGRKSLPKDTIRFALPHTLALTFFPKWLAQIEAGFGPLASRLTATNVHDAVMSLVEDSCDLLICYHHPQQPVQLDPALYDHARLGTERLAPYSSADKKGRPRFELPGKAEKPQPYLAYAPNAYLARMAELILNEARSKIFLDKRYETDMAEGLKAMALEGHGIAFLPDSAVVRELQQNTLVLAGPPAYSLQMEVRIYCSRSHRSPYLSKLWEHIQGRAGNDASPAR